MQLRGAVWIATAEIHEPEHQACGRQNEQQSRDAGHDNEGTSSDGPCEGLGDGAPQRHLSQRRPRDDRTDNACDDPKDRGVPEIIRQRAWRSVGCDLAKASQDKPENRAGEGAGKGQRNLEPAARREVRIQQGHWTILVSVVHVVIAGCR